MSESAGDLLDDHDLAILDEEDGMAYPVFCTVMVSPDVSPLTADYAALRKDHELLFVADSDQPFEPRPTTAFVHQGGVFQYKDVRMKFKELLSAFDPRMTERRGG